MEWRDRMKDDPAVKKSYLDPEIHTKHLHSHRIGAPEYDLSLLA